MVKQFTCPFGQTANPSYCKISKPVAKACIIPGIPRESTHEYKIPRNLTYLECLCMRDSPFIK